MALVAAVCLMPGALAARATLVLTAPEGAVQADATVPVDVALSVSDFMCHEPREFVVSLSATGSPDVDVAWSTPEVRFAVPAQSYFADTYSANATIMLTVHARAAGHVEVVAWFAPEDDGPCFVPDGFEPTSTTIALRVDGPAQGTPPPPATDETPPPDAAEPSETQPPAEEPEPEPATPTTPRAGGPVCGPDGNCGAIGEYQSPPQGSSESATPGAGYLLGFGVLAIAALVARRRA